MRTLYARGGGSRPAPRGLQKILFEDQVSEIIKRETSRADRTGRQFSVVLFKVKAPAGKRWSVSACRIAHVLLARVRQTDDVGWFDGHHLCAVLADTPAEGARAFAARACEEVAQRQEPPSAVVYAYPSNVPADEESSADADASEHSGSEFRPARGTPARRGPQPRHANGHPGDDSGSFTPERPNHGSRGRTDRPQPYANGHSNFTDLPGNAGGSAMAVIEAPTALRQGLPDEQRDELVEYFLNGVSSGMKKASLSRVEAKPKRVSKPDAGLEDLFVEPMPKWKRALDLIGASIGLILLSPVLLIAAAAIKLTSPGPVIFKQKRTGLGGKVFTIFKFRTMCVDAERQQAELRKKNEQDGPAFKLTNDPRVTKIGHLLRKTSIDELPQLLNVLIGNMSLVGPRPLPVLEQEGCEPWQRHRLNVTPGLTCIWQVVGRSEVTFDEWVRMDVAYMRKRSLWSDLSILFRTVPSVLLRRGAK